MGQVNLICQYIYAYFSKPTKRDEKTQHMINPRDKTFSKVSHYTSELHFSKAIQEEKKTHTTLKGFSLFISCISVLCIISFELSKLQLWKFLISQAKFLILFKNRSVVKMSPAHSRIPWCVQAGMWLSFQILDSYTPSPLFFSLWIDKKKWTKGLQIGRLSSLLRKQ